MISILSMVKTGQYRDFIRIKFEFEFDDASLLPIGTYTWGVKTYFIEEGSKARDTINNIYYEYIKGKWSKIITPPIPTFKTPKNTTYNDNGEYSVSNNDFVGFNDIKVDVSSTPPTLIEKSITENNTYNASDDGADGYSSVNVDVDNSYTAEDEGKVVSDGTLVAQTAMSEEVTENGTINTTLYNSVTVNVSGGGSISDSDVKFYDYDGTLVASYSAADFASLSAMPENPLHEGLTAQGWNWSLADAKSYVAAYGKLNIGQMYITDDGKTRFYYFIPKDNLTINLEFYLDTGAELNVDWGDGSEHTTWTDEDTSKSHTYQADGEYTVTISAVSGTYSLSHAWETDKTLRKVEIGSGVTSITALNQYAALTTISIPNTVLGISDNAFANCTALRYITIPSGVDMLCEGSFTDCSALTAISIPNSVNWFDIGVLFRCRSLKAVCIPPAVTNLGTGTFSYCYALTSIIIPSNITTIGSTPFQDCHALTSITFKPTTPPELSSELGIPTTCVIRVPQGTLSAYTSASNYPDPSQYIYEEY